MPPPSRTVPAPCAARSSLCRSRLLIALVPPSLPPSPTASSCGSGRSGSAIIALGLEHKDSYTPAEASRIFQSTLASRSTRGMGPPTRAPARRPDRPQARRGPQPRRVHQPSGAADRAAHAAGPQGASRRDHPGLRGAALSGRKLGLGESCNRPGEAGWSEPARHDEHGRAAHARARGPCRRADPIRPNTCRRCT